MRADLEAIVAQVGPGRMEGPEIAGGWCMKDIVAHLTAWRVWSVARMQGAVANETPVPPWSSELDEDNPEDIERINQQSYERNRDRPLADVLCDSRRTFDELEAALRQLRDDVLFDPDRFPWTGGYPVAAIIFGSARHLYEEHLPAINAFLARVAAE